MARDDWKTLVELETDWPTCGARPTEEIGKKRTQIELKMEVHIQEWLRSNRDNFLSAKWDAIVGTIEMGEHYYINWTTFFRYPYPRTK